MQSGDSRASFPDGVKIEQRLRRMFVRAVTGIDHARVQTFGEKLRRAGGAVAQDNDVGVIRFENFGGVLERFAFR